jgi:hypothetical protein
VGQVALIKKKTDEEQAADDAAKARKEWEKRWKDWFSSPPGQARLAYEHGDQIFQCAIDVKQTKAMVVAMVGAYTTQSSNDPAAILNQICWEGWDLVDASFVFVELGSESRDKFLASGQNVAVKGTVMGYYVFKRCASNRNVTNETPEEFRASSPSP